MPIPFLDLRAAIAETRPALSAAFERVLSRGSLILGPEVAEFETALAVYWGVKHAVGVGNGLDALRLMLEGLGVDPGDEVILPAHTAVATWLAVSACGARPVPVEVDPETHTVDPAAVEAAVTPRSAAILAVHLYGLPADMPALGAIAARHGLLLVADAAQAAGASLHGRKDLLIGHAAGLSFYPTKNLGALGDGGAMLTNDAVLADKVARLRNYGGLVRNEHASKGSNSRLDELQAAFLHARLAVLDEWNARRAILAARYLERLAGQPGIGLPRPIEGAQPAWHLFTLRILDGKRDAIQKALNQDGIGTGIYYPVPPHRLPAYAAELPGFAPLPICERLAGEVLSLPLHPHLTLAEADIVADRLTEHLAACR
jgi:dTDP-3-amino-3,4,6-trideoxy-alpha-D-glucose transaminase